MIVVGMVSAYKEGRLVRGAVDSLLRVGLDALYVYEGPTDEPLGDDVPDSDYGDPVGGWRLRSKTDDTMHADSMLGVVDSHPRVCFHRGRWRSDGRKRNEMLQRARGDFPGEELWGVIIDGDEVLWNAEYLRDRIQAVSWDDEWKGADIHDVDNPPTARLPLRLIERDGTLSLITARVVRLDLLRSIDISSSVVTNVHGVQDGWGNYPELSPIWLEAWLHAIDKGQMVAWPPFPCEPAIVHRAYLRHPLRRGLRMSDQETREFAKAKLELRDGSNGDAAR